MPPTLRPSPSSISMTLRRQYVLPAPGRPVIPILSASPMPPTRRQKYASRYKRVFIVFAARSHSGREDRRTDGRERLGPTWAAAAGLLGSVTDFAREPAPLGGGLCGPSGWASRSGGQSDLASGQRRTG